MKNITLFNYLIVFYCKIFLSALSVPLGYNDVTLTNKSVVQVLVNAGYDGSLLATEGPTSKTVGIPPKPNSTMLTTLKPDRSGVPDTATQVQIVLNKNLFDERNGKISFWAIYIGTDDKIEPTKSSAWDGKWPKCERWYENIENTYQVTPPSWMPFFNGSLTSISYVIGIGNCEMRYCNGALMPATPYGFKVRGFTSTGYQDTDIIYFRTSNDLSTGIIVSCVAFVLVFAMFIILFFYTLNACRHHDCLPGMQQKNNNAVTTPKSVSRKTFTNYTNTLLSTPGRIENEFQLIATMAECESRQTYVATQSCNRLKNRYQNILPYDDNRVILPLRPEDLSSDYVNASYIKGFSGQIEYIATQGPKETTTFDFWRMIVTDNVKCIFMLTTLYEKGMEKCFKYFPEVDKELVFESVQVSCVEQEQTTVYVKRVINVMLLDTSEVTTVTHYHVTKWSDFGCPETTDTMLELCSKARAHNQNNKLVLHCSAGVGRTGTMIAVDILLQTCQQSTNINVFDTVLKLRCQRVNMVQTEAQYSYIYKCICDYLKLNRK